MTCYNKTIYTTYQLTYFCTCANSCAVDICHLIRGLMPFSLPMHKARRHLICAAPLALEPTKVNIMMLMMEYTKTAWHAATCDHMLRNVMQCSQPPGQLQGRMAMSGEMGGAGVGVTGYGLWSLPSAYLGW